TSPPEYRARCLRPRLARRSAWSDFAVQPWRRVRCRDPRRYSSPNLPAQIIRPRATQEGEKRFTPPPCLSSRGLVSMTRHVALALEKVSGLSRHHLRGR